MTVMTLHTTILQPMQVPVVFTLVSRTENENLGAHYNDVIMSAMASQLTSVLIVYSTVCSGAGQRKHKILEPLAFVMGIHR